jgi:hypothetical protein
MRLAAQQANRVRGFQCAHDVAASQAALLLYAPDRPAGILTDNEGQTRTHGTNHVQVFIVPAMLRQTKPRPAFQSGHADLLPDYGDSKNRDQ